MARDPRDPTQLRSQPALTTSSGRSWLIVGGIFTVVALAVLIPMIGFPPPGVALVAAIVVAVGYATMIVARLAVPEQRRRRRLGIMATAMLVSAAVALVAVVVVAWVAAQDLAATFG